MNIIVDIETTGLPTKRNENYKNLKCYDASRIVQLAFIYTDFKDIYEEYNYIIKRKDFDICNSHIHGITNEISDDKGINISLALAEFLKRAKKSTVYAHNANFDITIIKSELYRLNMTIPEFNVVCTMKTFSARGYIKLTDLYYQKTGKKIEQNHNALNDCKMIYEILMPKTINKEEMAFICKCGRSVEDNDTTCSRFPACLDKLLYP